MQRVTSLLRGSCAAGQELTAIDTTFWGVGSCDSSQREGATRKLIDYVEEVAANFVSNGDAESCCKKLERFLIHGVEVDSHLKLWPHPFHHLALDAYTVLGSAYKVRAADSSAMANSCHSTVFNQTRTSTAYHLFLAAATHLFFFFEQSLISSAANFWIVAGESLVHLSRADWGLPDSSLPSFAGYKCHGCSLQNPSPCLIPSMFLGCASRFCLQLWRFLVQDCYYLSMFVGPAEFLTLFSNLALDGSESMAAGLDDRTRINVFELGVHCLVYGRFLADICYGPSSSL